jgi:hypothetical protein
MYSVAVLCIVTFLTFVHALPISQRDVYNPPITYPNAQTIWVAGSKQTVTWETANMPPDSQLTSPEGRIVLGWLADDSMNLQMDSPLAEGFRLRAGKQEITVPSVPLRNDYIVVLFGDSGNQSPTFTIQPGDGSAASPTLITDPIPITGTTITGSLTLSPEPTSLFGSGEAVTQQVPESPTSLSLGASPEALSSPNAGTTEAATGNANDGDSLYQLNASTIIMTFVLSFTLNLVFTI